jgi:hypothetical protein
MMAFSTIDVSLTESVGEEVGNENHPHRHQLRKRSVSNLPRSYYWFRKQMKNEKWKKSTDKNMDNQNDVEVHTPDENVASKLLPFYTYRQIIRNQRWKRNSDIFKPAYGFGKRSRLQKLQNLRLGLKNYLFAPFHYHNLFMNSPVGKSFYNI